MLSTEMLEQTDALMTGVMIFWCLLGAAATIGTLYIILRSIFREINTP
jgi:hypothetical protein